MIAQHLKFAVRHIIGSLLYSAINILGLSIGLACCLLILLYVRYESSYDKQWENSERLYRVSREYFPFEGARARVPAQANAPAGPALMEDFPEQVQAMARIYGGGVLLETDQTSFEEPAVRFADASVFELFDFEWIAGDPATALAAPISIVMTESLALKYFGTTDAIGRTLRMMQRADVRVTGVIKKLPPNTHLDLSGLISLNTLVAGFGPTFLQNWNASTDFHSYLLLRLPADAEMLQKNLHDFLGRHTSPGAAELSALRLMPITDIHLYSTRDEEWLPAGDASTLRTLVIIAFSILAIACLNFMSIATARSTRRSKEVGMRKAIGATRMQLVMQFLAESSLTILVALCGAIALMELLLPGFTAFTGIPSGSMSLLDTEFLLGFALMLVTLSIMAGLWSTLFLSEFKPASVLRGALNRSGQRIRNTLVVLQFAIAITLVVATLVMQAQQVFINSYDLGFDKENVVILRSPEPTGFGQQWPALKAELLAHPAVEGVTASHYLPFGFNDNQMPLKVRGSTLETRIQFMLVDFDFFETYEIDFLQGRGFSIERDSRALEASDQLAFVVNRSAARALGLSPEAALNSTLEFVGTEFAGSVYGVTDELHFETMRLGERPLIFVLAPPQVPQNIQALRDAAIRIDPARMDEALAHIDATWLKFNPGQSANRRFLSEDHAALYLADERQGQLLSFFATIAIAIACFGLFGLASYNAERRTKEIGVRKVMGGSVWSIVLLLTNDFSRLVLLANLIAWPVAYFAMQRWLENFAYRVDLTLLIFIGSGAIALCIAWATVAGTAAKAASAKPVLALRYE